MKITKIEITVIYEDEEGDTQIVRKVATDFESAEESLGKLQRSLEDKKV